MRRLIERTSDMTANFTNAAMGILLIVSPWVLSYGDEQVAMKNAMLTGGLITIVAFGALAAFYEWEEWANLILGLRVVASPWLLGFEHGVATYAHVILGAVIIIAALKEIWVIYHRPAITRYWGSP